MTEIEPRLQDLLAMVHKADAAVLEVYGSKDFNVHEKIDKSPVTDADISSHQIIISGMAKIFPNVPVISEENEPERHIDTLESDQFWLVDPLDGTREFLNRSGDFTICLGLIEEGVPTFGIVSAPAKAVTYYGGAAIKASYKQVQDEESIQIKVHKNQPGVVLASRMFLNDETEAFIEQNYPDYAMVNVGSQLKLPMIAEGKADVCPRLNTPQYLWDVAAGHAILEGAGGRVTKLDGSPLDYRNPNLKIGDFIATNGLE